jgi:hypothetical protein
MAVLRALMAQHASASAVPLRLLHRACAAWRPAQRGVLAARPCASPLRARQAVVVAAAARQVLRRLACRRSVWRSRMT